ncbi:MAG TPA: thioredoxin family protein [Pirellulales bacterium]|nr:thioredoxin family protein [Pirellulales bacterium]
MATTIPRRYLLLFYLAMSTVFAMIGSAIPAEPPKTCPINSPCAAPKIESPTPTPNIPSLAAALEAARLVYNKARATVAAAQAALTVDIANQAAAKSSQDNAKAALQAAIDALDPKPTPAPPPPSPAPAPNPPPPPPVPPPMPPVSLTPTVLAIGRTTGCPPCKAMKPIMDQIAASGTKVEWLYVDKDPAAQEKYQPKLLPTFIMLRDGIEVPGSRFEGQTSADVVTKWVHDWTDYRPGVKP